MDYITDTIPYPRYKSRAFDLYFGGMELGALDIETTGLSPQRSQFILGGLLHAEKDCLVSRQFFACDLTQEQETLCAYLKAVNEKDVLLTYNGHRFDLPFMQGRAKEDCAFPFELDLYRLLKGYSPIRKLLPNLKQKTVESFMGLWEHRKDEISGKESVELYYQYLAQKDPALKEKILLHNHDDLFQLYRLLPVLEKTDLHHGMFDLGFPVKPADIRLPHLTADRITVGSDTLRISGRQYKNPADYRCYEWEGVPCSSFFCKKEKNFSISVPLIRQSGFVLADLKTLDMDISPFSKYPSCQEGFLILKKDKEYNYLEINHFVKQITERILNQWITKK